MRNIAIVVLAAALLQGCTTFGEPERKDPDLSKEFQRSERSAFESHTLSRLAALERSLNDFIQGEGRIPKSLDELVPKYLAEIPEVVLGIGSHKDSSLVTRYGGSAIVDGLVNGSTLRDTGGWGYVHNESQVIVFVDCTHKNMRGELWYQARGVY